MDDNVYSVNFDKNRYVVMANDLIKGKSELTLQEARLVRLLIMQIAMKDQDLRTYQFSIKELADFLGIGTDGLYRDMYKLTRSLKRREIGITTGNPKDPYDWIGWISRASYDGHGTMTFVLSEDIRPYVLELSKWFTKYKYSEILTMNSYYAIRLYELIKCYDKLVPCNDGTLEFTIEYLRVYFNCEEKYKNGSDFLTNVIDPSESEISAKSDTTVYHENIKAGRKIHKLKFYISPNYKRVTPSVKH